MNGQSKWHLLARLPDWYAICMLHRSLLLLSGRQGCNTSLAAGREMAGCEESACAVRGGRPSLSQRGAKLAGARLGRAAFCSAAGTADDISLAFTVIAES